MAVYEVTFTRRALRLEGGERTQAVVVKARDEAEALREAEKRESWPTRRISVTVEPTERWTVYGEEYRPEFGVYGFSNGKTYPTKKAARADARFASDVIDRLTPLPRYVALNEARELVERGDDARHLGMHYAIVRENSELAEAG